MKLVIQIPCFTGEAGHLPAMLADLPCTVEGVDRVDMPSTPANASRGIAASASLNTA